MKWALRKAFLIACFLAGLYLVLLVQDTFFPSKVAIRARDDAEYGKSVEELIKADREALERFKRANRHEAEED